MHQNHLEAWLKQIPGPNPEFLIRQVWSVCMCVRICISKKFPGDAYVAGWELHFEKNMKEA